MTKRAWLFYISAFAGSAALLVLWWILGFETVHTIDFVLPAIWWAFIMISLMIVTRMAAKDREEKGRKAATCPVASSERPLQEPGTRR